MLIWFVVGMALGAWAAALFWRNDASVVAPDKPDPLPQTFLWGLLAGLLLGGAFDARTDPKTTGDDGKDKVAENPSAVPNRPPRAAYVSFVVAFALVVSFAAVHYFDFAGARLLAAEAFLLSPRVVALLSGMAIGFWTCHYRNAIARHLSDFYDALLGTETKSSWALQAAVALFALFAIILAIKPDLLDHIQSLRAGDVEAKFANASTTTREAARVTLIPFRDRDRLVKYADFTKEFRRDGSGRDIALKLYDTSSIKDDRTQIRDVLFADYIEPFAKLLYCVQRDGRLEEVRHDSMLKRFAIRFRNKIVNQQRGTRDEFDEQGWAELLEWFDSGVSRLRNLAAESTGDLSRCDKLSEREKAWMAPLLVRTWRNEGAATARKVHSPQLAKLVKQARARLAERPEEKRYNLAYIDPYITGALADFVALMLGESEKAEFLTVVREGYPTSLQFVQPGLVNLFYQLAHSKVGREEPWPIDEHIKDLTDALTLTEYLLDSARSGAREAEARSIRALRADGRRVRISSRDAANTESFQKIDYSSVIDVYLLNRFLIISKEVEVFVQRALAGDPLTDEQRPKWVAAYRALEAILNVRGVYTRLDALGVAERALPDQERAEWKRVGQVGNAIFFFEARANMALSALLLTEKKGIAPAHACAVSRTHLAAANETIGAVVDDLEGDGDAADKAHLKGYVEQVRARIDVSCRL